MKKIIISLLILLLMSTQIGCNKNIAPVELPVSANQPTVSVVSTKEIPTPSAVGLAVQSGPAITVPTTTPPPPPGPVSPPVVVVPLSPSTKTTPRLSLQIVASEDDITAYFDGSWRLWKEGLGMIEEAGGRWDTTNEHYVTGMRFRNITIPKGAVITSAVIEFVSDQTNAYQSTTVNTRFIGQADDNPGAFTTLLDLQARRGVIMGGANNSHLTSAQVSWDAIPNWYVNNSYVSPNLNAIAQEIINRPGWTSGNAMVIFWDDAEGRSIGDKAVRSAYSYDGHYSQAPRLNLTYYLPGETPLVLAPEVSADLALKIAANFVPPQAVLRSSIKVTFDSASNPSTWHVYFEGANVSRSELTDMGWRESANVTFGVADPPGFYQNILINVNAYTGKVDYMQATSLPSSGGPVSPNIK